MIRRNVICQRDNDRPDRTRMITAFLQNFNSSHPMTPPPRFKPDLNLIDYLCDELDSSLLRQRISAKHTHQQLTITPQAGSVATQHNVSSTLIVPMDQICQADIDDIDTLDIHS